MTLTDRKYHTLMNKLEKMSNEDKDNLTILFKNYPKKNYYTLWNQGELIKYTKKEFEELENKKIVELNEENYGQR